MIAGYDLFLNVKLYKTDLPLLYEGKEIKCMTWGRKNIPIIFGLSQRGKFVDHLRIKPFSYKKKIGYKIKLRKDKLEEVVKESGENMEPGFWEVRSMQFKGCHFDRLHLFYYDFSGKNISKVFNPTSL